LAQEASWRCVPFMYLLRKNNGKVITKYLFYDIGTSPKVLFKSDKYYNKKREKSDSRGGK